MKNDAANFFDRRGFLKAGSLTTLTALLGTNIVFADRLPKQYLPVAFDIDPLATKNKNLVVLNDKPWNVETPAYLLDDAVTPADKMFIRNNGLIPENIDVANWILTINGESVNAPKTYTLNDLKTKFKPYTYQLVVECGGNGRAGFFPKTAGNQWAEGGVSCAEWTGIRLKDLLADVGLKDNAVYIGYYGKDLHLSRDPKQPVISRGVPIAKALEDETIIAWAMNGEAIPLVHGYPLRLVIGGWPASVSGKWLHTIAIRDKVHDGAKMTGKSYRIPIHPVVPGVDPPEGDFKIIESMPVKSVITSPKTGLELPIGQTLSLRGHAWAGDRTVKDLHVSIDFGQTWQKADLKAPKNRLAWQHWTAEVQMPIQGYYEVWARATDEVGVAQPMVMPQWNPEGYINNACHRIAVKVV
ncbi:sulfite oxidase [Spirosoma horti]|uniref:Molybdopterin containing oxidoreductase n=1 Tax=Spirosoma pollinicola TaxID=2057025 RepID=A0A2K8Z6C8_9BACT|nr:sulfite oxidase [Spirosoma pollinicola]AUD05425.1 molybdopterin containing oxidoreductase [Spirosoma pollinicola]RYF78545.1 MAG: molybdopterin containing oxidoreductase [Cytophagaceae bacterium]